MSQIRIPPSFRGFRVMAIVPPKRHRFPEHQGQASATGGSCDGAGGRLLDRIAPRPEPEREAPMITAANIHYELGQRTQGLAPGGIGALLLVARRTGLIAAIDHRPPPPEAPPPLSRVRPRPQHRLQPPRRRPAPRAPRAAPQRRGLSRRPRRRAHPRPDHRRRLLPPLPRGRRPGPDGGHQHRPAPRLRPAARRLLRRGDRGHRRHPRRHRRGVQGGRRYRLRRHLGLSSPGGHAGQHRRAALPGQSQRQPPVARGGARLHRPGDRAVPAGRLPADRAPRRHRLQPDRPPRPLGCRSRASGSSSGWATMRPWWRWPRACRPTPTASWSGRRSTRSRRRRGSGPSTSRRRSSGGGASRRSTRSRRWSPSSTIARRPAGRTYRVVVLRKRLGIDKGSVRVREEYRYFFFITNDRDGRGRRAGARGEWPLRPGERHRAAQGGRARA